MLRFVLSLMTLHAAAQAPAATPTAVKAEDILRNAESALGWTGRFGSVLSLEIEGKLDGSPIKVSAKQPSLFRMDLNAGKDHIVQAYDGSFGWQMVEGEHPQPASELKKDRLDQLIDQASNGIGGPLVNAAARGTQVEYEGRERIDGKDCYKLKLTLVSGTVIRDWIDATTFLERQEEIISGEDKKSVIAETVGEFRRFEGILFPCRFISGPKGASKTYELDVKKVTINPPLAAALFAMPAALFAMPAAAPGIR